MKMTGQTLARIYTYTQNIIQEQFSSRLTYQPEEQNVIISVKMNKPIFYSVQFKVDLDAWFSPWHRD